MPGFTYNGNREPMKCIACIWSGGYFGGHQCKNKKVIGDYCKTHDPATVAAKRAARTAKLPPQYQARTEAYEAPGKRIAELEAALKGAVTLCQSCGGKGGWDAVGDLPYVACLLCGPYRSVL
jgi:hypothetical protein